MRKKDDSPSISLFSFQDIITSITGIMFLVVLLLLLLIFESIPAKQQSSADAADPGELRQVRQEITRLEAELRQTQEYEKQLKQRLEDLRKKDPAMLEKRMQELKEKLKRIAEELEKQKQILEQQQAQEKKEREEAEMLKEKVAELQEQTQKVEEAISHLKEQIERLKKQMEQIQKVVQFSVEQSSQKSFLVAEYGPDGFLVLDTSEKKTYDLRKSGADDDTRINALVQWLKGRNPDKETVSIILKPASLKLWGDIQEALSSQTKFQFGLELFPDDTMTIFPNGAGGVK